MAYQNVGTPRFYVNVLEWLTSNGYHPPIYSGGSPYGTASDHFYKTLPVIPQNFSGHQRDISGLPPLGEKTFIAFLGHTFGNEEISFTWDEDEGHPAPTPIVNYTNSATNIQYNGFSIATASFSGESDTWFRIGANTSVVAKIGSIVIGSYYDMNSPDLSLTMTREMDGVKRIRTKGGADLVKHQYTKSPLWGNAGAWELYSGTPVNQELSRSG